MKIAFLNIYNGKIERGSEVFVKELASKLASNHDVCVFQTGEKENEAFKIRKIPGIPFKIRYWQDILYHFWVLVFTVKCLPYLWRDRFDWIIPVNGRCQVLLLRLFKLLRGGKILISGHAGVGFEDRWNMILGQPDMFVALSPTAFAWAKNIFPEEKLVYIPNGIDTNKFKPGKQTLNLALKKPVILCVSALLSYKRLSLLIEAVSKLETVNLLIIGDGPMKKKIAALGNELLENRFRLIPHVPYKEIVHYYNASQLFSLPSRGSEAFGLVYLEAMACNLPVVAPDDINRREIVGEAGYLGDLTNAITYADLLDKALHVNFDDKPRKQAEKFSWGKIAQKYEEVFEKG